MSLAGTGSGPTRADIIKQAMETATSYYGIECVGVQLSNEVTLTINDGTTGDPWATANGGFAADWVADIKHNYWEGSYGRIECRHCKEWGGK